MSTRKWSSIEDFAPDGLFGKIVVGGDGVAHAVYTNWNADSIPICYRSKPPGGSWSAPVEVGKSSDPNTFILANLAIGGDLAVTAIWKDLSGSIVFADKINGQEWSAPSQIGTGYYPEIAGASDGTVHAAWGDSKFAHVVYRSKPPLGQWTEPLNIPSISVVNGIDIAVGGDVVYVSSSDVSNFGTNLTSNSGGVWSPDEPIPLGKQGNGTVISADQTGLHAVGTGTGEDRGIYYVFKPPNGSWSDVTKVSEIGEHILRMASRDDGSVDVAWRQYLDGYAGIGYTSFHPGSGWETPSVAVDYPEHPVDVFSIAAGPDASTHILWSPDPTGIYYTAT